MDKANNKLQLRPAPAGSPAGLVRVIGPWSGEMLRGMRVAAWRWRNARDHWEHATHWSTGPQERQERLYSEADVQELLASRDAALAALVDLEVESALEVSGVESEWLLEAKNNAANVLKVARESKLGVPRDSDMVKFEQD